MQIPMTARLAIALCLGAVVAAPAATRAEGFRVVVHETFPADAVSREELAAVFLKRATRWADGEPIEVVDQSLRSDVRVAFTHEVLDQSSLAVMTYWQQQLVRGGERPPAVKGSDVEVLEFVASTRGSIGYVSREAEVVDGVKVLQVVDVVDVVE